MGFILDFKTKMEDYKKAIDECKAYFCIVSLDCMIREKKKSNCLDESIQESNLHGTVIPMH